MCALLCLCVPASGIWFCMCVTDTDGRPPQHAYESLLPKNPKQGLCWIGSSVIRRPAYRSSTSRLTASRLVGTNARRCSKQDGYIGSLLDTARLAPLLLPPASSLPSFIRSLPTVGTVRVLFITFIFTVLPNLGSHERKSVRVHRHKL